MRETIKGPRRLGLRVALMLLVLAEAPFWCSGGPKVIYGTWCTRRVYATSNVQALSKAEAKAFVGTMLKFAEGEFQSGTKKLQWPKYEEQRFKAGELVDRFMILPSEIGATTAFITEIDIRDQSGRPPGIPGQTVLVKSPTQIVWYWKGGFFEATRCRAK